MKNKVTVRFIFLILTIIMSITSSSCQRKDKSESEDVVLKSYRLIDENRADEAITLLEAELKITPDSYDFRSILASAYAHKAGFKIQKLAPLVTIAKKLSSLKIKKEENLKNESHKSLDSSQSILKLNYAFEVFDTIPVILPEKIVYLDYAIHLLNSLDTKIRTEDVVYRALLKVLRLKYKISAKISVNANSNFSSNPTCKADLSGLDEYVQSVAKEFLSLIDDVKAANPDQKEKLDILSQDVEESISSFKKVANPADQLDDVASALLKQTLLQSNLGAFIKCQ